MTETSVMTELKVFKSDNISGDGHFFQDSPYLNSSIINQHEIIFFSAITPQTCLTSKATTGGVL